MKDRRINYLGCILIGIFNLIGGLICLLFFPLGAVCCFPTAALGMLIGMAGLLGGEKGEKKE